MSKISFSPLQEKAINAHGSNILVSAGAGSGKTAVLTERIYRIAKQNGTLDNFLVLTFTKDAAAEMKNRVRKKLIEDKDTIYLASDVDNSHIETFDAFSLYLVKKYFYELGVSKDINIIDNSIFSLKRKEIICKLFEEKYLEKDKDFLALIDELDKTIKVKFKENFDKVVDNFQEIFVELFGGGQAELRLENEEDPLNSGIDIVEHLGLYAVGLGQHRLECKHYTAQFSSGCDLLYRLHRLSRVGAYHE